ncbi:MAG TPA: calcium-binding protein [Thermococcaceae archaeon]|uniref:Predicted calcium-binding protein n=1 Tax=Thermococcus sibiricus (strain DSM 12597 / MM 739) TaxID=604354 RepID=C6A4F7_THESM|nr:hypothetical protein [Thermococcus sibiricus]ACS90502.1 Predicted calcium-binding protein [Thermococcus sibiricus MM 739]HII67841.1 calcium-binding protein [Thermococcaceae archaeon]
MGKFTAFLLILLILGGLYYIYNKNPDLIKDIIDDTNNGGSSGQLSDNTGGGSNGGSFSSDNGGTASGESGWSDTDGDGAPDIYVSTGFGAVSINGSYIITKDRNEDGVIDAIYLDTTGDGDFDTSYLDEDYNGKTDTWITAFNGVKSYAWDLSGDGIPDVYDTNGDGKVDAWDLNSDGVIDEKDVDYDGTPDLHDYDFDGIFDEFEGGANIVPPENTSESFTCPPSQEEAYELFVQAYNNVTSLMGSNASQEEQEEAYAKYLEAKACYESSLNSGTSISPPKEGTFGEIYEVTLSTPTAMMLDFSTGDVGGEDGDIMLEPWCVDYPAILGNYAETNLISLEDVTVEDIPSSGYTNEDAMEIKIGYVYINRNSDGSYTAFVVVTHEKIGECDHKVTLRYRTLG